MCAEAIFRRSFRKGLNEMLNPSSQRKDFIVGAAIGSGAIALAAVEGGADFILALNAGRFRIMGAASTLSMLPVRESNSFSMSFAVDELLNRCPVPVYFGASVMTPSWSIHRILDTIEEYGFPGIVNFPTCAHYPPVMRQALEAAGFGFSLEIALLKAARKRGILTMAHLKTKQQARAAARAGVDMVCYNFGWNAGGELGFESRLNLQEATWHAREVSRVVKRYRPATMFLLEGGPIEDPAQLAVIYQEAEIDGYVGGSTIDRLPLEISVKNRTSHFKSAALMAHKMASEHEKLVRRARAIGFMGTSPTILKVVKAIYRFAPSTVSVLISGEPGTGRHTTVDAIQHLRGDAKTVMLDATTMTPARLVSTLFGRRSVNTDQGLLGNPEVDLLVINGLEATTIRLQKRIAFLLERGYFTASPKRTKVQGTSRLLFISGKNLKTLLIEKRVCPEFAERLKGHEIELPPLRHRLEDIGELFETAIKTLLNQKHESMRPSLSPVALRRLMRHDWPGNLPELRATAARFAARHTGDSPDDLLISQILVNSPSVQRSPLRTERDLILDALWRQGFHRSNTAKFLGISRKTLYNKIRRLGIDA
jgi:predicted TIM-barrel enzyme/DNA-binding NtrC family response regulator